MKLVIFGGRQRFFHLVWGGQHLFLKNIINGGGTLFRKKLERCARFSQHFNKISLIFHFKINHSTLLTIIMFRYYLFKHLKCGESIHTFSGFFWRGSGFYKFVFLKFDFFDILYKYQGLGIKIQVSF